MLLPSQSSESFFAGSRRTRRSSGLSSGVASRRILAQPLNSTFGVSDRRYECNRQISPQVFNRGAPPAGRLLEQGSGLGGDRLDLA